MSDRNFDDLPDWLTGDDDQSDEQGDMDSFLWETDDSATSDSGEVPSQLGVTGALPWRQGVSDQRPAQTTHLDNVDWDNLGSSGDESEFGFPELDEFEEAPEQPPVAPSAVPDWLFDGGEEAFTLADAAPQEVPDWITEETTFSDQLLEDEPESLDDLLLGDDDLFEDAFTFDEEDIAPPPETRGIRRISESQPEPPSQQQQRGIRRLTEAAQPQSPQGDMTFDEWERQQEQQVYETEHAEELAMEAEVPDWFRDNVELGDAAQDELASLLIPDLDDEPELPDLTPAKPSASGDYVPEWFMGLEEQNLEDAPEWVKAAASGVDTSSLLDASAFAPPEPEPLPAIEELSFADAGDDVPEWFKGLGVDLPADDFMADFDLPIVTPSEHGHGGATETEPSWLQDYEMPEDMAAQPSAPSFVDEASEAPDLEWMDDLSGADFSADVFEEVVASPAQPKGTKREVDLSDAPGLDDLLGTLTPATPSRKVLQRDTGAQDTEAMDDLFDGIDDSLFEALETAAPTTPQVDENAEAIFEAVGPEWVEQLRPDVPIKLRAGGLEIEFEQQGLSQIPDDLQELREETIAFIHEAPRSESSSPQAGTLAGITGGLAPQSTSGSPAIVAQLKIPDLQQDRVESLAVALDIAEEVSEETGLEEQPRRVKRRRRIRRRADRFLISVILLVAVLAPFASDSLHLAQDPIEIVMGTNQQNLMAAVSGLDAGDRVLIAFEYGPTAAGELNELAEAVIRDILRQRAIPIVLSTNPLGILNARQVFNELADDARLLDAMERDKELEAGKDYFMLRYLSGGSVAIRSLTRSEILNALWFSTDSTGEETNLEIDRVAADTFAMVIVVGESTDDIRNWAEQFDVVGLPKFALVSSAIEPIASAYVSPSGALAYWGYLAGYRDTYRYNTLRNQAVMDSFEVPDDVDIPDPDISQWHSMALGALVAGLFVLLGLVFNTMRGLRRQQP